MVYKAAVEAGFYTDQMEVTPPVNVSFLPGAQNWLGQETESPSVQIEVNAA